MALQDAINTRIGEWGAKGLSGGQKRRVSICIEILTRPKFLFLDEPTSRLDSAVYFGLASMANEFFALNGFPCPTLQNPSDHFLKTINKDFQKFHTNTDNFTGFEEGLDDGILPTEEAIDHILIKSYKSSGSYEPNM
ncbi:hypothetical protein Patl1_09579 [Pistacia atlantica]|uniref:Uncharacterized protein n=1 Tax=Pistacia atlantica TaxID=434234 RepID=A0ACC1A5X7_9ROSI|nr:hypothetical protein Patl1_09579 [Pistacia atlantica]